MTKKFLAILAMLCASMVTVSAQTLNEDVLRTFLKQDPHGDKIVALIQNKVSKIDIDLSFEHQLILIEKGTPQNIIDALVKKQGELNTKSGLKIEIDENAKTVIVEAKEKSTTPSSSYPTSPGKYVMVGSSWQKMEHAPLTEMSNNFGKIKPWGNRSMGYKISGPEAPVITGQQPQFLIVSDSEVSMRAIKVVKLAKRGNDRELSIFSKSKLTNKDTDDTVDDVQVQRLSTREILIKTGKLPPGPYAVSLMEEAGVYDFTVKETIEPISVAPTKNLTAEAH